MLGRQSPPHDPTAVCVCLSPAGSYFALSLFDRMWHPQLTEDEAIAMMEVRRGCEGLAKAWVWTRPAVGVESG